MEPVTSYQLFKLPEGFTLQTFALELLELKLDGDSKKLTNDLMQRKSGFVNRLTLS